MTRWDAIARSEADADFARQWAEAERDARRAARRDRMWTVTRGLRPGDRASFIDYEIIRIDQGRLVDRVWFYDRDLDRAVSSQYLRWLPWRIRNRRPRRLPR